jgi:hypothetical protein
MYTPNRNYTPLDTNTPVNGPIFTSYYTRPTAIVSRNLMRSFADTPSTNESFISNHTNNSKYMHPHQNPEASNLLASRLNSSFIN